MYMKGIIFLMVLSMSVVTSCNEPGRGHEMDEVRGEAAGATSAEEVKVETQRDAQFIYEVIETNYSEIKLAELGNQRSRTPGVKKLAEVIREDRTSLINRFKVLAQNRDVSVPVEEAEASRRKMEDLAEASSENFDKEWREQMMDLYEKNIRKFEKRLDDTADEELKSIISEALPELKRQRGRLEALSKER